MTTTKARFTAVADGLYTCESQIHMPAADLPLRSTAVRCGDGTVVLISPPNPKKCDYGSLAEIGPVRHIVAPNSFHNLFVSAAHAEFPEAKLWAPPALKAKRPGIPWDAVFGSEPWPWAGELDVLPIEGIPSYSEVVFLHPASRTLITTDLFFNLKNVNHVAGRILFGLMGTLNMFAVSRLVKVLTRSKVARNKSLERMMAWNFDRLIMAHGDIVQTNGKVHAARALKERLGIVLNH